MNDLSEREKKFLQMIYDHAAGDEPLVSGELYELAGRNGFDDHDVLSISNLLNRLGLLQMQTKDEKTAAGASVVFWVKLTSRGISCMRCLE